MAANGSTRAIASSQSGKNGSGTMKPERTSATEIASTPTPR